MQSNYCVRSINYLKKCINVSGIHNANIIVNQIDIKEVSIMKILVAYDGTLHSKVALEYGIRKVREKGGEVLVLQVFQASLFVDYDAGPRAWETARDESRRHIEETKKNIETDGGSVPGRK